MQANLRAFGSSSRRHLFLSLEMVVLYLAVVSLLVWLIARGNAGFSYALDDPYIHLALAQHLRHGFYGLNPGEYTSPSSSIVWPFLLVPFADGPLRQWFPLILNVIPGVMLCCLVASFVTAWHRQVATAVGIWAWIALGPLLVFAADLPSLALIGMEHSLQLLTVGICAFAVVEAYAGRKIPVWMLAAAACAPAIRYEDLIFTLVVVAACWLGGQRRAAMLTGIVALLPILAFGLFLHWHGLQFFPNSILAKSGVFTPRRTVIPGAPLLNRVVLLAATNIVHYVIDPDRWALTFFAGLLLWLALRKGQDHLKRRLLFAVFAGLLTLMLFGPYGWFYRYDVAYRLFALLIILGVLASDSILRIRWTLSLCLLTASLYFVATKQTIGSSKAIALQQKQLQRFTHSFYRRNVAINDLGWVAFDSGDRFYICDLLGLASTEAAKKTYKDAAWLEDFTARHGVGLVAIYAVWFKEIPHDWQEVATMHRESGDMDVTFFVTPSGDRNYAIAQLRRFALTLPSGAWMTFAKQ